jgi:Fe-S-cluster formation regulator IscX/YfhJ
MVHEESLRDVVHWALKATWDSTLHRPWTTSDPNRNRFTLLRTIVWYLDTYKDDIQETVILRNGKPAVELSFNFESGYTSNITGEPFTLCGHLDRLVAFRNEYYVSDVKTTKSTIGDYYFAKYDPDNQMTLYSLAAFESFKTPVAGVIVDAAQIAVTFTRFRRGWVGRSEEQLSDWQKDLGYWLALLEDYAVREYWPKNDMSCDKFGGCPFRPVCSQKSSGAAQEILNGVYKLRQWNPLEKRGDI